MGVVIVAGVAFVLFWFQPQKLWIDDRVDEPIPVVAVGRRRPPSSTSAAVGPTPSAPVSTARPEPVELARGEFVSLDHGTRGVARVLELADGRRIVRLEGLDTSNGPDLYLYVTTTPAAGDESAFDDEHVNLGRLKGNQGDQNYDLPPDTDLARFATVADLVRPVRLRLRRRRPHHRLVQPPLADLMICSVVPAKQRAPDASASPAVGRRLLSRDVAFDSMQVHGFEHPDELRRLPWPPPRSGTRSPIRPA